MQARQAFNQVRGSAPAFTPVQLGWGTNQRCHWELSRSKDSKQFGVTVIDSETLNVMPKLSKQFASEDNARRHIKKLP